MKKLLAAVTVLAVSTAQADTIYVDDDAPLGGDGMSWNGAYRYLQDALADAEASGGVVDEIRVGQGSYRPDLDEAGNVTPLDTFATFRLVGGVMVAGGYAGLGQADPGARDIALYETTLTGDLDGDGTTDGGNSRHIVTAEDAPGQRTINGFTITLGRAGNDGGGAMLHEGGIVHIQHCRLVGHHGGTGGVVIRTNGGTLQLLDSEIGDSDGIGDGIGLSVHDSHAIVERCVFFNNLPTGASLDGGAIWVKPGTLEASDCTFTGNEVGGDGGAIYADDAEVTLTRCDFTDQDSNHNGGAIYIHQDSTLVLEECSFTSNHADYGAAVYALSHSFVEASGCTFTDNSSTVGSGGAIFSYNTVLCDSTFTGNFCADNGGALWIANGSITRCTFIGNDSFDFGGAVSLEAGATINGELIPVTDCTFIGNNCGQNGGALAFTSGPEAIVERCRFESNFANFRGGALYASAPTESLLRIRDCTFVDNSTFVEAGALYLNNTTQIFNSVIAQNAADLQIGGGVMVLDGDVQITNCTISGNSAVTTGGIYHAPPAGTALTLTNCILWGNSDATGEVESSQLTSSGPLSVDYTAIMGLTGGLGGVGNIGGDPQFVDPDNGDLRLAAGSACIDAADNAAVPAGVTTDLDGNPRFLDVPETPDTGSGEHPIVDMGAYESLGGGCLAVTSQEIVCHADGTTFTVNIDGINACTGGLTQVTFTASGGAVGQELCFFTAIGDGSFCCFTQMCVTIPDCTPTALPSDLDGDGIVGMVDFLALLSAWGSCSDCGTCPADFDGDCSVGILDLLILLGNWTA
jgi:predicted outer membrane repeat protein